jgi:oligopeptide transport system substrate-binding protein
MYSTKFKLKLRPNRPFIVSKLAARIIIAALGIFTLATMNGCTSSSTSSNNHADYKGKSGNDAGNGVGKDISNLSKPANTLYVDIANEPASLDPALAEDWYSYRVINDLFAGLMDFDQTNKPILGLAARVDISPDGKTYTFHLRDNLKFSDGTPLTAADVVYSWQRLVDPKTASPYNFILRDIVNANEIMQGKLPVAQLGIKDSNPNTVVVSLTHPSNAFLTYITLPNAFVVPKHIIQKFGNDWTNPKHIVTTGAYTLKEHVLNGHITTEKNPNYYGAENVAISHIEYFPYIEPNTSIANYKTGHLDITGQTMPVDQYQKLKIQYPNELHTAPWERIDFLNFNMMLPKYADNPNLRRALSMAIDREIITKKVLNAEQQALYSTVSPTIENGKYADIKYSWSTLSRQAQSTMAQKLYKEAGYSKTHPLTITLKYKTSDLYKKVAIAIAAMWTETLGVNVILQNQEWKTLVQALHKGDYDIATGGWGADFNSITTYTPIYQCGNGNNNTHYCNHKYDALINQAENTIDPIQQEKIYKEAINFMLDEYTTIPLFEPTHQRLINPRVQNYNMEQNYLDNVQSKWIKIENK